eukprot:5418210-Pleurochrysis_carterae.AAC.2
MRRSRSENMQNGRLGTDATRIVQCVAVGGARCAEAQRSAESHTERAGGCRSAPRPLGEQRCCWRRPRRPRAPAPS